MTRQHEKESSSIRRRVTVVIPTRNEQKSIPLLAEALAQQVSPGVDVAVLIVDDASTDATVRSAESVGFKVLRLSATDVRGNPAAARNLGARHATGDLIVFLDADCVPAAGWLEALLQHHDQETTIVGGSLDLPPGLSWTARVDYYCGWYHVHSRRPEGYVSNHPPGNISISKEAFGLTEGFTEEGAAAYAHEELDWQSDLLRRGHKIYFEPKAVVDHYNRPGLGNLFRRNYRWGYSALASKATTGAARWSGIYKYPRTLIILAMLLSPIQAAYVVGCWLRAGRFEPLAFLPFVLAARFVYSVGFAIGGIRWLRLREHGESLPRPIWE